MGCDAIQIWIQGTLLLEWFIGNVVETQVIHWDWDLDGTKKLQMGGIVKKNLLLRWMINWSDIVEIEELSELEVTDYADRAGIPKCSPSCLNSNADTVIWNTNRSIYRLCLCIVLNPWFSSKLSGLLWIWKYKILHRDRLDPVFHRTHRTESERERKKQRKHAVHSYSHY